MRKNQNIKITKFYKKQYLICKQKIISILPPIWSR